MEAGATLTLQPDVVAKFAHERADDYYGITVEGTLMQRGSLLGFFRRFIHDEISGCFHF